LNIQCLKFVEHTVLKIISEDDFCVCLFGYSLFTLMVLCHELAVGLLGLFTIHKHKTDICKHFDSEHCV